MSAAAVHARLSRESPPNRRTPMPITGEFPEAGFRIEIERSGDRVAPWTYRGHAVTPTARWEMKAFVSAAGAVTVELAAGAPEGAGERARRIIRAVWKHADAESGRPPPRRIVRWRPDP